MWASQLGLVSADEARAAAARIEALGFGALWVGEADGREALTHAGLLLEATERLVVATGIANIWARDAQAMINGARTLAEAHEGRFVLGIGASHAPLVERRGRQYDKPYSAMIAYLDAMERAGYTSPLPEHEPDVVLAALGPKMLELAGDRAAGAHTFFVPPEHSGRAREILGEGSFLAPEQAMVIARDRGRALDLAAGHVEKYLELPNYRRNLERLGWSTESLDEGPQNERLFDALVAWGGVDGAVDRIRAHEAAGADHVAVHVITESATRLPLRELEELSRALG
ncbi:MAG: TIGR03620 family F420-dependent LLM class oxidoreductase [Nitriliruptorales bacterium]|nr:TIGR03620 family F420-dependent LLM class oxidoreductase [Nitriliruptorales bacterium]